MRAKIPTCLAAACLTLALAAPAEATQSISCTDMKGDSGVDILLGTGPVPNVLSLSISVAGRLFTTQPGQPGEPVVIAQSYDDGEVFRIDLMDDQVTKRVAAIRLLRANHESDPLQIGFLQIEEEPPVGISCVGP